MSKGVKKVLGFVAAVFIPFAAPAIATAMFGASTLLTSSLVGAGLGAIKSAALGENVGRGALMGGLGGALGQVTGAANTGIGKGITNFFNPNAAAAAPQAGLNVAAVGPSGIPGGMGADVVQTAATEGAKTAVTEGAKMTFGEAIKAMPSAVLQNLTDPAKLADLTLRAGSMLLAGAMTSDPMAGISPEEQQLVEARKQELMQIQSQNQELFNQQMKLASDIVGSAAYFNQQYFADQAAKEQQLRGAKQVQSIEEKFVGGQDAAKQAEIRRSNIETGLNMASAYAIGGANAEGLRAQRIATGAGLMPKSAPTGSAGDILNLYRTYRDESAQKQAGLQNTFTDFATRYLNPYSQPRKEMPSSI